MISDPEALKNNLPRVFIKTFGCQMNKLDTELSISSLVKKGYSFAEDENDADVILLNTCSVRDKAEHKVYSQLGSLRDQKEKNPALILGVLGCMAQNEGDRIFKRMPHVDLVCGTRMFSRLPELLGEISGNNRQILAIDEDGEVNFDRLVTQRQNQHNAFVSIMRGCDNYCSYCIVPYVRGREFSRSVTDIVDEVKKLADDGCKEITLLGQNVNSYGKGLKGKVTLASLLRELDPIDGIERVRFVTSHPKDMTKEIIESVGELSTVCEYLHMPVQSGSDKILKKMRRQYSSAHYKGLVDMAKSMVPGIKIASDFIVGFPGETEEDFEDTVRLFHDVRFQNSFIFKYSPRTGTAATELIDSVDEEIKKRRNHILLDLQKKISTEENRKMHGKFVEVMVEGGSKTNAGRLSGRTRQNQIVVFNLPEGTKQADVSASLSGKLVNIEIEDSTDLTLFGVLRDSPFNKMTH
ncbi:2-methylthioadenine synthetase [Candidatus Scalindua japonica]|uniref:tRNA-2-methylthio-N(6)-dimethylallyladenosine synthase n=1 Tax=Candidatus Scalindua japonica TaxID=1284222 RepID=A0A286U3U1_9BACT|nr:tRNA (N6-isopentenyl adenosine(37)-C2)-methylthiotransferase MiaB [Candidatus Scalindua japonica]GAX62786.1 2-methylthioadenine synthetase [Candidatus Scalindua japonica]